MKLGRAKTLRQGRILLQIFLRNTDGENGNYGGQPFEDPRPPPRMMDDYDRPPPGRGDHRGGGGGRGRGRGGGGGRGGGFTPSEGDWPCPDPS